ncbi:MAG: usg protein [Alphaproteobacteria bacterium]
MAEIQVQLANYRLTTAEILYHMPDHPSLLQSYIWQEYDMAPQYPQLKRFLDFWVKTIEGKLYSVRVAHKPIITASEIAFYDGEFLLN